MNATAIARPRLVAIDEQELDALHQRIEEIATTVNLMKAAKSSDDLMTPKEIAKRYKVREMRVYEACTCGQIVAEHREGSRGGRRCWLILPSDALRWYVTFIRKEVNQ